MARVVPQVSKGVLLVHTRFMRTVGATALAALLLASACGGSTAPAAESMDFAARSWPEAAAAPCANGAGGLSQVRAVDASTVQFTLCAPDVAFTQKLALTYLGINDSGYLKAHAADGSLVLKPNGTGPYALKAWEKGAQIVLNRFDGYWGDKAKAKTLTFTWQPDAAARLVALRAGTADGIDNVSPTDAAGIAADSNFALVPRPALNTMYIGMRNLAKPFNDVRVRKAIALALDRQRTVDYFYPAGSEVASHYVPCSLEFACEGDGWYAQDVAAAKALLAEAGYPNGFTTTIALRDVVRSYLPTPVDVATDIQSQLAAIGVTAKIDVQESTTYFDNVLSGKLDGLFLFAWIPDYPDTLNFIHGLFGVAAGPELGDTYTTIATPAAAATRESDPAKRKALIAEANAAIKAEVPIIPIAHGGSALAFSANVSGAHSSPLLVEQFSTMASSAHDSLSFVQGAEPGGLACADEIDGESLRVCSQINEGLYGFFNGSLVAAPRLATGCTVSADGLAWTCTLRSGVRFHNGATFDASDVVDSFAAIWDCAHPYHVGRTSTFLAWGAIFGANLHPESCVVPN
ncbi:MAG: peptide ABC transporter substrate-binding protein [Chloroflexi bacterium]|nr:MAG: peptide ABC transporter substrate-binding protein [Chloroflexota bacterium]